MKTKDEMIKLNKKQGVFYDNISKKEEIINKKGYSKNPKSNFLTKLWAILRYQQQIAFSKTKVENKKENLHNKWLEIKKNGDYLEIGCFNGNVSSWLLIDKCKKYLGVDLSSEAIKSFQKKIKKKSFKKEVKAIHKDFLILTNKQKFDVIYAHGVLHHFENPEPPFKKIYDLLKDDGVLIITEPSEYNPIYKFFRLLYRPFQSDSDWEWPFNKNTVSKLNSLFKPIEGFGWGKYSLFFSLLIVIPIIGRLFIPIYNSIVSWEASNNLKGNVWMNSTITCVFKKK